MGWLAPDSPSYTTAVLEALSDLRGTWQLKGKAVKQSHTRSEPSAPIGTELE